MQGNKELLGLWMAENEGAKFWLSVLTELKIRGVEEILIACVDGLKGFTEAIQAVYPQALIQLCIVHTVRNSMRFVSWEDYKVVAAQLKAVYQAPTEQQAVGRQSTIPLNELTPSIATKIAFWRTYEKCSFKCFSGISTRALC